MDAKELYDRLESDFITKDLTDDWAQHMVEIDAFITPEFKKRSMGLVCDFAKEINTVHTSVFPSNDVLKQILDKGTRDALLFVHHPSIWDIRKAPAVFTQMDPALLEQMKERRIAIYNLHVPLDNYTPYATSVCLAKALCVDIKKPFAPYHGGLCGVIGKFKGSVGVLKARFKKEVGHTVTLYPYGSKTIKDGKVAIIAGGGNDVEMLEEVVKNGVNTFVTGITAKNDRSRAAHDFAEKNKINILGGTHYSTEKFACIAMQDYFRKLGLDAQFIEDEPVMEDI